MLLMGMLFGFMAVPLLILLVNALITGGAALGLLIASVMVVLPAIIFAYLGLRDLGDRPIRIDKSLERRVLQLAAVNDGELTASKLALGSQLRVDDCQKVLEQFEALGVARGHIGSQGEMRYTFPELQESMASDDDFMRRLQQEDPRSVLDFDVSEQEKENVQTPAQARNKGEDH